jgi:hypothetical protein
MDVTPRMKGTRGPANSITIGCRTDRWWLTRWAAGFSSGQARVLPLEGILGVVEPVHWGHLFCDPMLGGEDDYL